MDANGLADWWFEHREEEGVRQHIYGSEDDTWMGSALRVMCYDDDLYYRIDCDGRLHKVSREKFTEMHQRYLDGVRVKVRERIELLNKKAA